MRFVCESCRAQYMINDEKVGPKGVKVRCRKCGYVILVKRADAAKSGSPVAMSNDPDDALATQVMQSPVAASEATLSEEPAPDEQLTNPGTSTSAPTLGEALGGGPKDSFFGADEDEIGAVFDQVLKTGPHAAPKDLDGSGDEGRGGDDRQSTRVIDADTVRKLAEESGPTGAPAAAAADAAAKSAASDVPDTDWYVAIDEVQTGPLTLEVVKRHWDEGEIGPDSLCWREGFDDWIPISQAEALASVLAPKPARPIIVAPAATITQSTPAVMSVPVQSAFSSGGMMQTMQSEMQVPVSASMGAEGEDTGWRPSSASALASLVKDEMDAISRPPPKSAPVMEEQPPAPRGGGFLDLPEERSTNAAVVAPMPAEAPVERLARPSAPAPVQAPVNPYLSNPGATYSAPAVTQYRPPGNNRNLVLAIAAGGALLLVVLIGLIVWLATRQPQVVVQPTPVPVPVAAVTPTPAPAPAPIAAAPVAAAPVAAPVEPAPTPEPAAPVAAPADPTPAQPRVASPRPSGGTTRTPVARAEPSEPKETKRPAASEEKDEFAAAFGGSSGSKTTPKDEPKGDSGGKKTTYIPPAPGGGGDVKASLAQSDIMEVVLANKGGLAKCAEEQRKRDPGTSGKLVMRWTIQTSGRTSNVGVVSEEFKGTYMATCVGGLIKGWTFPRHKTQGEPVSFPFKF